MLMSLLGYNDHIEALRPAVDRANAEKRTVNAFNKDDTVALGHGRKVVEGLYSILVATDAPLRVGE